MINEKLSNEAHNPPLSKGVVSGSAYTCDCGQKAKMPICFDCFKKGLERNDSPMLYSTNQITNRFVIKVFIVMFVIGLVAYAMSL
jgi:hypothetical protein